MRRSTLSLLAIAALTSGLAAQPNKIKGMDARLMRVEQLQMAGRLGTFPTGRNGITAGVVICNLGITNINWFAPMDPRHPFYSFMIARESNGRFEQISDRSFLKHGFASINGNGCGGTCRTIPSTILGPQCSDVYSTGLNADRFYLGPADEVDPWLGAWDPNCSHFDRGEPAVKGPAACDGRRSLTRFQTQQMDPVTHRLEVEDTDLNVKGARYFYGSHVVIAGEPEPVRDNNMVSREVAPSWNGSRWIFGDRSAPVNGTILQHWSGAEINSAKNGIDDDGRVYVANKVTGPDSRGFYRYEYAIHNRDNFQGVMAVRFPISSVASVLNVFFKDVDQARANDWQVTRVGNEVVFTAVVTENTLRWNTIYNFGFDSSAAPVDGMVALDEAGATGAPTINVAAKVPQGLVQNEILGAGCGSPAPLLFGAGNPPFATIPNGSFGVQMQGLQPNGQAVLLVSPVSTPVPIGAGCTIFPGAPLLITGVLTADASGSLTLPAPISANPGAEGASFVVQGAEIFTGGPAFGGFNLTNGMRVRIGNNLTVTP